MISSPSTSQASAGAVRHTALCAMCAMAARAGCHWSPALPCNMHGADGVTLSPGSPIVSSWLMALVCVTGGNGFVASWLIKLLLERGYTVRATVRDSGDPRKTAHLQSLPGAHERLELFTADLLVDGSFDKAVEGCEGVFHTASPVQFDVTNPEEELIMPAVKGTLNILNACAKSKCLKRVVLTSSLAAVSGQALIRSGAIVVDESCWSDEAFHTARKAWYSLSKLVAEQKAWAFAKEKGLDLVVLNPGFIAGRPLQDRLDAATEIALKILTGQDFFLKDTACGWVDVRDVTEAHLLAFENPTASGRYICAANLLDSPMLLQVLQRIIPGDALPAKYIGNPLPPAAIYKLSTEKIQKLGLTWRPIEETLKEIVEYLQEKGLLPAEYQIGES